MNVFIRVHPKQFIFMCKGIDSRSFHISGAFMCMLEVGSGSYWKLEMKVTGSWKLEMKVIGS